MTELKPCPLCGYESDIFFKDTKKHLEVKIKCGKCTCLIKQCYIRLRDNKEKCANMTADLWNIRQPC